MLIIRKENNKEGRVRKFFKSLTQGAFFGGPKNQKTRGAPLLATLLFALFSVIFLHTTYVLALATKSSTPASLPSNGLVAHHTFDGKKLTSSTSTDSSSQGNNGTLTNGPKVAIGKIGQALYFDGVDDYVTFGDNILAPDTGFTASFWVKHATTTVDSYGTVRLKGASSEFLFEHGKTGNSGLWGRALYFGFRGNTAIASSDARYYTDTSYGKWNHYIVVYNGGTKGSAASWKLYINGEDIALGTEGSIGGATNANEIGRDGGAGTPSQSYMDDVRVYNRTLIANEMTQLSGSKVVNKSTLATSSITYGKMSSVTLPVSNGLVGHWTFDGKTISTTGATTSAQDVVGGYNGTFTNMSTTTSRVLGKVGQAITFDGADDYISVGTSSVLGNKPLSVSFWAKSNVTTSTYDSPIGKVNTGSWTQGWGFYTTGTSQMNFFIEGYSTNSANFTGLNPRVWHHYVGVWDGTNIYIYVDGVRGSVTDTYTGSMTTSNLLMTIGSIEPDVYYNWNGPIDDVRVYNRALSQKEVQTLYKMGGI